MDLDPRLGNLCTLPKMSFVFRFSIRREIERGVRGEGKEKIIYNLIMYRK